MLRLPLRISQREERRASDRDKPAKDGPKAEDRARDGAGDRTGKRGKNGTGHWAGHRAGDGAMHRAGDAGQAGDGTKERFHKHIHSLHEVIARLRLRRSGLAGWFIIKLSGKLFKIHIRVHPLEQLEDPLGHVLQLLRDARPHGRTGPHCRRENDVLQRAVHADRLDLVTGPDSLAVHDAEDVHLPKLRQGKLVGDDALSGEVRLRDVVLPDENADQRVAHGQDGIAGVLSRPDIQHGRRVVDHLVVFRREGALYDPRLRADGGFHQSRVKADALVVDEVLIRSAGIGHAAVGSHGHQVVGVVEGLAVDLLQLEESVIVELPAAHGGAGQIQNAGPLALGEIMERPVALVIDLCRDARERIADGVILPVGIGEDAGSGQLGKSVADGDARLCAVRAQKLIEAPLFVHGNRVSADEEKLHAGQVDPGRDFVHAVELRRRRDEQVDLVVCQRVIDIRIEQAEGDRDHRSAKGKRKMHRIHQHIGAAQIRHRRGHCPPLKVAEARIPQEAGGSLVHAAVRQRHGLVDAAGSARGVDNGGVVL